MAKSIIRVNGSRAKFSTIEKHEQHMYKQKRIRGKEKQKLKKAEEKEKAKILVNIINFLTSFILGYFLILLELYYFNCLSFKTILCGLFLAILLPIRDII